MDLFEYQAHLPGQRTLGLESAPPLDPEEYVELPTAIDASKLPLVSHSLKS